MAKGDSFTNYQKKEIVNLYQKGLSTMAIAREINLGRSAVGRYLQSLGLKSNNTRKVTQQQKEEIISLYKNGMTCQEIENLNLYPLKSSGILEIVKKANEVRNRGYRNFINHTFFSTIDTERKAYWIGFILADGSIRYRAHSKILNFELKIEDKYIIEELCDDLWVSKNHIHEYKQKYDNRKDKHNAYVRIYSNQLCEDLSKFQIIPNKTLFIDKLPDIDKSLMPHFIRGYFDGDGTVYFSNNYTTPRIRFGFTGMQLFLEKIRDYLCEEINLNFRKVTKVKTSQASLVFWDTRNNIDNFYNYIYANANIFLKRKKEIFETYFRLNDNTEETDNQSAP